MILKQQQHLFILIGVCNVQYGFELMYGGYIWTSFPNEDTMLETTCLLNYFDLFWGYYIQQDIYFHLEWSSSVVSHCALLLGVNQGIHVRDYKPFNGNITFHFSCKQDWSKPAPSCPSANNCRHMWSSIVIYKQILYNMTRNDFS